MMRALALAELAGPLQGQLHSSDASFETVDTDSRSIGPGQCFVALRGDRFDGHDYLAQVAQSGAAVAIVERPADVEMPQLVVGDTQRALGRLGRFNRDLFGGPLVGITGSSGKTSVKNLLGGILSAAGKTMATEGNYNNELGVPLTLLRLSPEHAFAVVEMGAGRCGDIAYLCELGRPDVSVLVNAGPAHLEGFGTIDDVARGKGEIFDHLGADGWAIINADQHYADAWRRRAAPAQILTFGLESAADVTARNVSAGALEGSDFTLVTPQGDIDVSVALAGRHNVANALAAAAAAQACGVSLELIAAGLKSVQPVGGRLRRVTGPGGSVLIDDCYNANPGSVKAAINLLAEQSGRRTLVLGVMAELGPDSEALHREVGVAARTAGLDRFYGVGEALRASVDAFGPGGEWFANREVLLDSLPTQLEQIDCVLIKGSRSAGMEQVLKRLDELAQGGQA